MRPPPTTPSLTSMDITCRREEASTEYGQVKLTDLSKFNMCHVNTSP